MGLDWWDKSGWELIQAISMTLLIVSISTVSCQFLYQALTCIPRRARTLSASPLSSYTIPKRRHGQQKRGPQSIKITRLFSFPESAIHLAAVEPATSLRHM